MTASHDTHDVFNQSPPYEDVDLYASDAALVGAVTANHAGAAAATLSAFGRRWGTAVMFAHGHRKDARLYQTPEDALRKEIGDGAERFERAGRSTY